jgi:hypothetical protein
MFVAINTIMHHEDWREKSEDMIFAFYTVDVSA